MRQTCDAEGRLREKKMNQNHRSSVECPVPERFKYLRPYSSELIRLGNQGDGGYVVSKRSVSDTKLLLSLGIEKNWSFDTEFLAFHSTGDISYIACDRASGALAFLEEGLRKLLTNRKNRIGPAKKLVKLAAGFLRLTPLHKRRGSRLFYRRWVRSEVVDRRRDLDILTLLSKCYSISQFGVFIKMDIEGGEYELLPHILNFDSANPSFYSGFCIEFHDIERREAEFISLTQKLLDRYQCVNVHANNAVEMKADFPDVVEISFERVNRSHRDFAENSVFRSVNTPNNTSRGEIYLTF